MDAKQPRDRRHRTERARQERRDLLQKEKNERRAVIEALVRKRAEMERSCMATQDNTLTTFSKDSILTTSNPTAPGLLSVYAAIDDMTDGGIGQSTFDDEFIHPSVPFSPAIASISVDLLKPRNDFEGTGRAQPPTPGQASQPNQIEQEARPELATQEQALLMEFEEQKACKLVFKHVYLDEGESEMDPDDPTLPGDHYPSDSDAGEDDDSECGQEVEGGSGMEVGTEELLVQDEWVVQDAEYPDQRGIKAEQLRQEVRGEHSLPGLHKQKDIDVEVSMAPEKPFPSGLINVSQENVGNPFKMVVPHIVSNSDIDSIAQIVCFVVITLHFLGGLATSWCVFLLKAFAFLFEALGRPDIAGHIPSRLATVQSYSGIPSYHVTALPVCPACGDVFPVGYGAPVDCPRCSIPLYENLLKSTNHSIPNPMCEALVPRIRLPFLSISAQLEGVFSSPGIEYDIDWWRTLKQQEGVYQDISDGKIWGEILDTEGKQFFRSVNLNGRKCAPDAELRIGVALAMDWCV